MDFYEPQEELVEYRELSIPALVGWVVSLLSPLALVRPLFFAIPMLAFALSVWGLVNISLRPTTLSGRKLAMWGLALALCFGTAGACNYLTYTAMDIRSGQVFAQQWMTLMVEGRDKEACQLSLSTYQRVTGRGLEVSFRKSPTHIQTYEQFKQNYVCQYILQQYRGAKITCLGLHKTDHSKRKWTHTYEFELSMGEGRMRKSRRFMVAVECDRIDTETRYEWCWAGTMLAE